MRKIEFVILLGFTLLHSKSTCRN